MMSRRAPRQYEDFALSGRKCGFGLSWNGGHQALDLQAVAFDSRGRAMDAAYYNNLKALGRGLTHTGDEKLGERRSFQEVVWVNMDQMPQEAQLVVLVVASYRGGRLQDAVGGKYHILQDNTQTELASFGLERLASQAAVIGVVFRDGGSWALRLMEEQAPDGQHFIDILEPTIGDVVRLLIPSAPRYIKASFAMSKGSIVDLPSTVSFRGKRTCAGLSWDDTKGDVDLDVSAIMMDESGKEVDTVFFGNEEAQGIKHSGDSRTGGSSGGDREVITLNFEALPAEVHQIFFVINIYSKGTTFDNISGAACRVYSTWGREEDEFCQYKLTEASNKEALIMARLFRESDGVRWGFQAIGAPSKGRTYKDTLPEVEKIAAKSAEPDAPRLEDAPPLGRASKIAAKSTEPDAPRHEDAPPFGRALPTSEVVDEPPFETMRSAPALCGTAISGTCAEPRALCGLEGELQFPTLPELPALPEFPAMPAMPAMPPMPAIPGLHQPAEPGNNKKDNVVPQEAECTVQ